MKKMEAMKRILSFLLCFVMVFGMLPVNAFATDTEGVVISEEMKQTLEFYRDK